MSVPIFLLAFLLAAASSVSNVFAAPADPAVSVQELTDAIGWLKTHCLSEEEFVRASKEPHTAIFDASDIETYDWLHVEGAIHLTASARNIETLLRVMPGDMRILIYQNNNFRAREKQRAVGDTNEIGIPFGGNWSGVNVQTCTLLRRSGYNNICELATYIEIDRSKLPLVTNVSPVRLDCPVALSLDCAPSWLGKPLISDHAHL